MKQVLQNFKTGDITVEEVPIPSLKNGCVLVKNKASLISRGTEGGRVQLGKMSLLGKARARPEQVKKVLQALRTEGLKATVNAVNQTLDVPLPIGYSCAGIVEATADDITDIQIGTSVACGGSGAANHAGYVVVPRNLCAKIPEGVSFRQAAFTTVGAIAMQGLRTAELQLGENVVVIGLGLLGLVTVLMLKASGCRVLGVDIDEQHVSWITENDICPAVLRSSPSLVDKVSEFSGGYGTDAVIITAAVPSNDPVALAGEITRQRGRVVVLGRTRMDAPRDTYLFKELQLRTSYAYGPGADDPTYEREGHDYPLGFVRWTENRNMGCFLDLINENRIDLAPLITEVFPIDKAPEAFELITKSGQLNIGVVLEYPDDKKDDSFSPIKTKSSVCISPGPEKDIFRVGVIGAGSFATNTMIPLLAKRKDLYLQAIASATGTRAAALAKKYGIRSSFSEANEIIEANDIDVVFIFTRHGTHATFAEKALLGGKHVFVEKPLALTEAELKRVIAAQENSQKMLMVGFNRPFSPLAQKMKNFFCDHRQPMMINYRGNVGYRPPDHWLHDPFDGGGIILGEASHYIDFCRWMAESRIVKVNAECLGPSNTSSIPEDNVVITMNFEDGTLAVISYISNGAKSFSRERCEVHANNSSGVWEDFRYLKLVRGLGLAKSHRKRLFSDKGFHQELEVFLSAIKKTENPRSEWLPAQLDSSLASIKAAKRLYSKNSKTPHLESHFFNQLNFS